MRGAIQVKWQPLKELLERSITSLTLIILKFNQLNPLPFSLIKGANMLVHRLLYNKNLRDWVYKVPRSHLKLSLNQWINLIKSLNLSTRRRLWILYKGYNSLWVSSLPRLRPQWTPLQRITKPFLNRLFSLKNWPYSLKIWILQRKARNEPRIRLVKERLSKLP